MRNMTAKRIQNSDSTSSITAVPSSPIRLLVRGILPPLVRVDERPARAAQRPDADLLPHLAALHVEEARARELRAPVLREHVPARRVVNVGLRVGDARQKVWVGELLAADGARPLRLAEGDGEQLQVLVNFDEVGAFVLGQLRVRLVRQKHRPHVGLPTEIGREQNRDCRCEVSEKAEYVAERAQVYVEHLFEYL